MSQIFKINEFYLPTKSYYVTLLVSLTYEKILNFQLLNFGKNKWGEVKWP